MPDRSYRRDVWLGVAGILSAAVLALFASNAVDGLATPGTAVAVLLTLIVLYIVAALLWEWPLFGVSDVEVVGLAERQGSATYMASVEAFARMTLNSSARYQYEVTYNCHVGSDGADDQTIRMYKTRVDRLALAGQMLTITGPHEKLVYAGELQPQMSPPGRVQQLVLHEGDQLRLAAIFTPPIRSGHSLDWEFRERWPHRFDRVREHHAYTWTAAVPPECVCLSIVFHIPRSLGDANFELTPVGALVEKLANGDGIVLSCKLDSPGPDRFVVRLSVS